MAEQLTGHNKEVTTIRIGSFRVAPNGHWVTMAAAAATADPVQVMSIQWLRCWRLLREETSGCVMWLVIMPSQQIQWQLSHSYLLVMIIH